MVGREQELKALTALSARSSGAVAALVTGVSGSGKSRLLAEVRSLTRGRISFSVAGFEAEQQVPLAAAAELLRGLTAVPRHGPALEALVFSARRGGKDDRRRPAGALDPLRIFEAAHRALQDVGPAMLLVDDLQWVDELSWSLCHYLIRSSLESERQLVVLVATRPEGGGEELVDALPVEHVQRMQLAPLDESAGTALALALDPRLDPDAARQVWQQARGLPFWIDALARHGLGAGAPQQVLTRLLRGAEPDAPALLGCLALAETPISAVAAGELLDLPPERVRLALDLLVHRGLVIMEQGSARVTHDLIRTTAVAQLPEDVRSRLHLRLAAHFERQAGQDLQLLRRALAHRQGAGLPVLPLIGRVARAPRRRLLGIAGAHELASLADEAELVEADEPGADPTAVQAGLAALFHDLGAHEQALNRWSSAAERGTDDTARASAWLWASRAAYELGRSEESRELLARSRERTRGDSVLGLEQKTHEAAIRLWLERETSAGRRLANEAVRTARRLGRSAGGADGKHRLRRAWLDALRIGYEAAMQHGDPRALLRTAEEWETAARRAGVEDRLTAGLAVGVALRQNGRVREAIGRFRRVWADARRAVLPRLTLDAGFWLARSLMLTAQLEAAEEIAVEAGELAGRVGDVPRARHLVSRVLANVWLERGRRAEASAILERETTSQANEHQRIVLHADRALWAARLHGSSAAGSVREQLRAAQSCAEGVGCPRCEAELLILGAEALARIGDHDAAGASIRLREEAAARFDQLDRLMLRHAAALASSESGARTLALREALASAEASPYRLSALWIRLDLGRELAESDPAAAAAELGAAAAGARTAGAETVRDLAEQSLRALGVRTWHRGAAGAPLTRRETEVAKLVASGVTNREVASALFISLKTVERHLVNLFGKLEVRNRTELAARLAGAAERTGNPR